MTFIFYDNLLARLGGRFGKSSMRLVKVNDFITKYNRCLQDSIYAWRFP